MQTDTVLKDAAFHIVDCCSLILRGLNKKAFSLE